MKTPEAYHVESNQGPCEGDICIIDENGLTVATVMHAADEEMEAEQLETAAILAAAPQLLALLHAHGLGADAWKIIDTIRDDAEAGDDWVQMEKAVERERNRRWGNRT